MGVGAERHTVVALADRRHSPTKRTCLETVILEGNECLKRITREKNPLHRYRSSDILPLPPISSIKLPTPKEVVHIR